MCTMRIVALATVHHALYMCIVAAKTHLIQRACTHIVKCDHMSMWRTCGTLSGHPDGWVDISSTMSPAQRPEMKLKPLQNACETIHITFLMNSDV